MKAVQITQYGPPSVLAIAELPDPQPGPGEIAIDVSHSAVGLVDLFFRQGAFRDRPGMPQPPFVPGLEVAGTVRALGEGVSSFRIGEPVVSMSGRGIGGYAEIYITLASRVVSIDGRNIDPALAVAVVPNAAMAHAALTAVAHISAGERVLVHGALGGFASAFPGIARRLGASKVVGTVRASKLPAAAETKLPYDRIVDSATMLDTLAGEKFDVVIDAVGGTVRSQSLQMMNPGGRLIVGGNASGDWPHQIASNDLWMGSLTVAGFNAGAFLPTHPHLIAPGLAAAVEAVADGLGNIAIDLMPLEQAAIAHERMEARALDGRIVLKAGR